MNHYYLVRTLFVLCSLCSIHQLTGQNLTISASGQTGTSGTNWTTSGSNPVTVNVTGAAGINTSVITGYLNAGTSVIVNNTTVGTNINSNIAKTAGADASLTIKDIGCIKLADNVTVSSTSGILNIILWADSDNSQGGAVDDFIYCGSGTTLTSNGGKIVLAGGPDNGSNGGTSSDGIPDGFAWNGSNAVTYGANLHGGLTLGPRGTSGSVVSLSSNGGEIICRGATSNNNGYPGITSQGNLMIESGAGRITMYGKSTSGHGVEFTYGAIPAIAISSASTSSPAISIKGEAIGGAYGFWASNNAAGNVLIQSTASSGGGVTIEGTSSTNVGLCLGVGSTNIITQVLSQSGNIILKGSGTSNNSLYLYGDEYIGNRKDATTVQGITPAVTAGSANILIQANDQFNFSNTSGKNVNISSTGSLTIEAYSNGYSGTVSWTGNNVFSTGFSSIILGESAENYSFTLNNSLTAAGNITAYTSDFTLASGVGLTSSVAGTITINAKGSFNTSGTARRTISSVNGNINVYADADASGNGQLDIDYLTFNPGSGNITLRAETLQWLTAANTDKPYINGTGSFTIEPADASFQDVNTQWIFFDQDANGIGGLTIGKSTNTGNISHQVNALNIAGAIALYGGYVVLDVNLTSSANGDIFIKANTNRSGDASIDGNASILKTAGSGTLTMQGAARINSGTVTASGTGVLNVVLWSDFGNNNNGGVEVDPITTNGGHLWVGGSNSNGGSYTWNGLSVGNGPSVGSVNNNYNALDFYGPISTNGGDVLLWGGDGYSGGTYGISVMGSAKNINTGSGDLTLMADNIDGYDLIITSTGILSLVPDGSSYPSAVTWNGTNTGGNLNVSGTFDRLFINNLASLGGLIIGYNKEHLNAGIPVLMNNTSNITFGIANSVAGPITLYGTALTVNQNLVSTVSGDISLYCNSLSIGTGVALSSGGNLVIEPITAATTIGVAGGTGTLAVTATNFNTNFTDGFAEIRIGNATAGAITWGTVVTLKDPLRITTSGNMQLNETVELGANNFHFIGNTINVATNKFVKTNGYGKLFQNLVQSGSKLFPIGITTYNPVTITNRTGITDEFYVTASPQVYFQGGVSGTQITVPPRVDLTWNIGNSGASTGAGNVDLSFAWNVADIAGSLTSAKLSHHNGTVWELQSGSTTVDLTARTLSYASYTGSFSPFVIAVNNAVLPVTWLSFTGKRMEQKVELNWSTADEQQNAFFNIERKEGSNDFKVIGRVNATQTPGNHNEYTFVDLQPSGGRSYYRIQQVDRDGQKIYSSIISVTGGNSDNYNLTAALNTQQLVLTIPSSLTENHTLLIYDASGRQVFRKQVQAGRAVVHTGFLHTEGVYVATLVKGNDIVFRTRFVN